MSENLDTNVPELLSRYGYCSDHEELETLESKAQQIATLVRDSEEFHAAILEKLSGQSNGMLYTYYAISIALQHGRSAPYAWAAWSSGLRWAGMREKSKMISSVGLELCPRSPEILLEVCRSLCWERKFPQAKRYRDLALLNKPEFSLVFEQDEEFTKLNQWIRLNGSR